MLVSVVVPKRSLDPCQVHDAYRELIWQLHNPNAKDEAIIIIPTVIRVYRSRVLWNALGPCLLESSRKMAQRLLAVMLKSTENWSEVIRQGSSCMSLLLQEGNHQQHHCQETGDDHSSSTTTTAEHHSLVYKRRLRVCMKQSGDGNSSTQRTTTKQQSPPANMILWIEPTRTLPLEDAFMGRLVAWEHKLIRAQSLTGYIATLGGGFFLCHHFRTAVLLAQEQQKLALQLNDRSMYLKCILNSAYNYIYAGYFGVAIKLIKQVLNEAKGLFPPDPVLVPMCYSARLFSKRMKRASQNLLPAAANGDDASPAYDENNSARSKTFDDFARIRIARDQSRQDDLVIPFGSHNAPVFH